MSLIIYDNETQHNETIVQQVSIPVLQYHSFQSFGQVYSMQANSIPSAKHFARKAQITTNTLVEEDAEDDASEGPEQVRQEKHNKPNQEDICSTLTNSQQASGEWKNISALIKKIIGKDEENQDLISAIAITYIQNKCSTSYSLLAQKGKQYLINKLGENETAALLKKAQKLLSH